MASRRRSLGEKSDLKKVNDRFLSGENKDAKIDELRKEVRNTHRREQHAKKRLQQLLSSSILVSSEDDADYTEAFSSVDRESIQVEGWEFPDADMRLLWESQRAYIATEDKRSFRWHPKYVLLLPVLQV